MNLVVETDLGHDPDDFFALCYLHSAGANIRAILLTKGHPFQVELARFFCYKVGLSIPIGVASFDSENRQRVGFNKSLLNHYDYSNSARADAYGHEVAVRVLEEFPDCDFFICGPPKNFGRFLNFFPQARINRVTVQGGFLSYNLFDPTVRLSKFEGKETVPTFNLNGAKKETQQIVDFTNIKNLSFVSKNVCHTIVYDRERHKWMKEFPPENTADELFLKGMDLYLDKHPEKKFHDPTAAVCHLHPEIATWFPGRIYSKKGGWGTRSATLTNSRTIADINRVALWDYLKTRK